MYLSNDFLYLMIKKSNSNKNKGLYNSTVNLRSLILYGISNNKININNILWKLVKTFGTNLNFSLLSKNPNLTIELIKETLYFPWSWDLISRNPGIKMKNIENNLNLQWDWKISKKKRFINY